MTLQFNTWLLSFDLDVHIKSEEGAMDFFCSLFVQSNIIIIMDLFTQSSCAY